MSLGSAFKAGRTLLQGKLTMPKLQLKSASMHRQNPTTIVRPAGPFVPFRPLSSSLKGKHMRPNPKLRVHAISLAHGDYSYPEGDDDDYDDEKFVFPNEDDESEGWEVVSSNTKNGKSTPDDDVSEFDRQAAKTLEFQKKIDARKARWIENAKPKVRVREIDDKGRAYGRGGRKTSTARVWIQPGEGNITVNRRDILDFFPRETHREMIISPFVASRTCGQFDVTVSVEGGGVSGKAGAIRHGVARALERYNPDYRPPMKRLGFMTRDPRKVERKKPGLKKARKAPQWVRR